MIRALEAKIIARQATKVSGRRCCPWLYRRAHKQIINSRRYAATLDSGHRPIHGPTAHKKRFQYGLKRPEQVMGDWMYRCVNATLKTRRQYR